MGWSVVLSHLSRRSRPLPGSPADRLAAWGSAIIATFAPDGPEKCSGLPCVRYSPDSLLQELGEGFRLDEWVRESHPTPFETIQEFGYQRFTRVR